MNRINDFFEIKNFKNTDVLFEWINIKDFPEIFGSELTKFKINPVYAAIWADKELKELILCVDGVIHVALMNFHTYYLVAIDPRYDSDGVMKEILANIKCRLAEGEINNPASGCLGYDVSNYECYFSNKYHNGKSL